MRALLALSVALSLSHCCLPGSGAIFLSPFLSFRLLLSCTPNHSPLAVVVVVARLNEFRFAFCALFRVYFRFDHLNFLRICCTHTQRRRAAAIVVAFSLHFVRKLMKMGVK